MQKNFLILISLLLSLCSFSLSANYSLSKNYSYSNQPTNLKPAIPILHNKSTLDKLNANPTAIEIINELKKYYITNKINSNNTIPFSKTALPPHTEQLCQQIKRTNQLQSIINLDQQ